MSKQMAFDLSDLYSEIKLSVLLNKIAERICSHLHCEESSIFLYDSLKDELYFEIATGNKQDELKAITLKMGEGIVGWIGDQKKEVIINDCANDKRFSARTDEQTKFITRSIAGVPVLIEGKLLGVLEAINKIDGDFSNHDLDVLKEIANFINIPLQNAMLFKKVMQETLEKDRLIELGKMISSALNLEDVFKTLRDIICEMVTPTEINLRVNTQGVLYKLIGGEKVALKMADAADTSIIDKKAIFPLRTRNKTMGSLEIIAERKISAEVVDLFRGLAVFAAISIEKFELIKQMIEKEKMEKELQIAKEIQQSFLLTKKVDIKGLQIAYINVSSSEVGGDYYDVIQTENQQVILTINDISGHGVPASLLMSIFRANFVYRVKRDENILSTISHLNNLIAETTDPNLYVTSFSALIDLHKKTLRYINAGHVSPFIVRGSKVIELKEASLVLGMFADVSFSVVEEQLDQGDLLVLYTDGVIEAENSQEEQYSYDRFKNYMKTHRKENPEQILDKFTTHLKEFVGDDHFEDDITFIVVKIL